MPDLPALLRMLASDPPAVTSVDTWGPYRLAYERAADEIDRLLDALEEKE